MSDIGATQLAAFPTFMNMHTYSNVSGGQVIQAVTQNNQVTFVTGNGAQANVEPYDINYVGGTLHIIDSVLTIPSTLTNTLLTGGLTAAVGALRRAGVESPLNLASDVTIFAPNNDAFNAIGSLVNSMTLEQLTTVLNYHVIQGKVLYSQLIAQGSEVTAAGAAVNFRIENGALFVNSARVVASDVLIGNGVVHVLDGVLNPNNSSATPNPSAATQEPAFNGATSTAGGVPFTSAVIITTTSTANAPAPTQPTPTSPPVVVADAPVVQAPVGVAAVFGGAAMWVNW